MFLFEYYNYFSITSVVIFVLFITLIIIGFKNGFMEKFLSISNSVCGLIFSVLFCSKLSEAFVQKLWGESLTNRFLENIHSSDAYQEMYYNPQGFLSSLGLPEFISKRIDITGTVDEISSQLAGFLSNIICVIIAFLILFFGSTILVFFLKLFAKLLRQSRIIRFVDGILGVFLYSVLFYLSLCLIFLILSLVLQTTNIGWLESFANNDMNLIGNDTGIIKGFRLSKWLYENNLIGNFFGLFF